MDQGFVTRWSDLRTYALGQYAALCFSQLKICAKK